jgi:hypothetical protein
MAQDVGNALGQDKFVCPATVLVIHIATETYLPKKS